MTSNTEETTSHSTEQTRDTVETIAASLAQQANLKEIFPTDPYDHINDKISKEKFLQNAVLITAEALFCLGLASSVASFIIGEESPHVGLMVGGFVTIVFSVLIFGIVMCMKCATKLDDKKQNPTVHDFTVNEIQKAYEAFYGNANSAIGKSNIPTLSVYDTFSQTHTSTLPSQYSRALTGQASFYSRAPLSYYPSSATTRVAVNKNNSKYSKETSSRRQRRMRTRRPKNPPREQSCDTYKNFDSTPPQSLTGSMNRHKIIEKHSHSYSDSSSSAAPRIPEKQKKKNSIKSQDSGAFSGSNHSNGNPRVGRKDTKKSKRSSSHRR